MNFTMNPSSQISIVDDDESVRESLENLLKSMGFRVRSFAGAEEFLRDGKPDETDCLILDVRLCGMSGPELYAHCHRHSGQLARRFLFASADPVAARLLIADAAARVGAERAPPLIAKPMSRSTLLSAVSEVAAGAAHDSGTYELCLPHSASLQSIRDPAPQITDVQAAVGSDRDPRE